MKSSPLFAIATTAIVLALAGCSGNVRQKDVQAAGHPEVVYIQPPANLYVYWPVSQTYAPTNGSFIAGAILGAASALEREAHRSDFELLTGHETEVDSLGFNDRTYEMVAAAIAATPWLAGARVSKVQRQGFDADAYTRKSKADSVIYLTPAFTLDAGNSQHFGVDLYVTIIRRDPRNPLWIQKLRDKDITFDHALTLITPDMNWNQQKDAAHQVAAMSIEQARQTWLEHGGARLNEYFAQDLQQMGTSLRQFFGD